ncbi:MAG: phosphate ABC transporter permease subunit PstC [Gemmataceae bacterium]|nr:phosphate ABC transporter permease subunit PstC [Gemmataceae bacterium]
MSATLAEHTEPAPLSISRPPTNAEIVWDRFFRGACFCFAWLTILLVVLIIWEIGKHAFPAMQAQGLEFITGDKWDAGNNKFGILPEILGTLYSSLLGVGIATVLGVAVAIVLTQDFVPPILEVFLKNVIELLAAIPSVVYGLWGIFVVIPAIRPAANWLHEHLGEIPLFGTRLSGPGMLPAALVLAIMVLPTITAISRDSIAAVPPKIREAAYGLGATKWETILAVILPTSSRGIFGSVILGFGRALGETMALAMLVGNASNISWSLFAPGNTLAALLANKFPEASRVEIDALMYAALVLLTITLAVNVLGTWIIMRTAVDTKGGR